jgi:hypothetical protein
MAMLQYTISVKYYSPDFYLDTEKESLLLGRFAVQYRVHFLNVFLFLAGPEGSGRKNFKIWTQSETDA